MNKGIENKSNTYRMSNLTGDATIKTTDNNQLSSNALTPSNQIDDSNLRVEIIDGQTRQPTSQEDIEPTGDEAEEELVLKYSAQHVIKLFIPVSICLVFVIISLSFITSYQSSGGAQLIYTPFNEESQQNSTKLWMSLANALIFIAVVVVMTVVLIVLYKFKFYKVIYGWLAFSSLMLLFFFTYLFISEVVKQFNIVVDMFTISIFLWNFGILGMVSIHWKGPLILQQVFLIFSCVQMALIFIKYLPEWTTWVILAFISIWDLIAVLCPFGPLRILVETARSRNDNLFPAMVYSSAIMYTMMANIEGTINEARKSSSNDSADEQVNLQTRASNVNNNDDGSPVDDDDGFLDNQNSYEPARNRTTNQSESVRRRNNERPRDIQHRNVEQLEHQAEEEEENGVKLGLGDFIFYSILVGKASILGDWNTVIACFIAILIGLCFTLVLLAIYHKPLPALPISLFFGLIFYFSTNLIVRPFYDNLTYKQIFI